MVSVIVPVHNMSHYLAQTLDSCLQITSPVEVIIMDDGSTDDSFDIACAYAARDARFRAYKQANAGVSVARNHAIQMAEGDYIFPLDADDLIAPDFLSHAVPVLAMQPSVRVVGGQTFYCGDRQGQWRRPVFSHALLARKNMLPASCLYRKADWERVGGYCQDEIYREDWDFWLSLFSLGGDYVELSEPSLYYRIRSASRRSNASHHKRQMIDMLNRRHADYFRRYLGGPLHYHRSWSRLMNALRSEVQVGTFTRWHDGVVLRRQRNTLRLVSEGIIKDFQRPNLWKAFLYGFFRKTKARRSYEYALRLGDLTPKPLAYHEVRCCGLLLECQYLSVYHADMHTFEYVMAHPDNFDHRQVLHQLALFTAQLHEQGILHTDYSRGNLLFNHDASHIMLIDLNRIRWDRRISIQQGIDNLSRLHEVMSDADFIYLSDTYKQARS